MTQITDSHIAVAVPTKIANPHFYRVNNESIMFKWDDVEHPMNVHDVVCVDRYYGNLEEYKWPQFLFTTDGVTEEQAATLVLRLNNGVYHDYAIGSFDPCDELAECYLSSVDSLKNLIRSKGLPEGNYAILKKV
jgi:hypothetical protein